HAARGGGLGRRLISWSELRSRARDLLQTWEVDVDVTTLAGALSVEQRQLVEIARALSFDARFIILDEPTAQLDAPAISRCSIGCAGCRSVVSPSSTSAT